MLGGTHSRTLFGELVTDLVLSAETPKDDDIAARVWLAEKQALFLLLERENTRRPAGRRRDDVDRMLADRGLDRWRRSHDAAAERQKRADMAREGHTHTQRQRPRAARSRRSEQLKSTRGHVTRTIRARAWKRLWRGAEAGGTQGFGEED